MTIETIISAIEPPVIDLSARSLEIPVNVDGEVVPVQGAIEQLDEDELRFYLKGREGAAYFRQRGGKSDMWADVPKDGTPSQAHHAVADYLNRIREFSVHTGEDG